MTDSNWGKPGFAKTLRPSDSLYTAVEGLKISTRQAFYAVATKKAFRRGTWNGCAFNGAADGAVSSFRAAADYFGETEEAVRKFIRAWDQTAGVIRSDQQATVLLKEVILHVGVTEVSPCIVSDAKVYTVRLFTSEETQMVEELRAEIDAGAWDEILSKMDELALV